jgi:hypothetical protein
MIMDIFYNPYILVIFFIIFLIAYFVYLDVEGSFANEFLHFGPGGTVVNSAQFMGITLDSWSKVLTLYVICFTTGLLSTHYDNVVTTTIINRLTDPNVSSIPYSQAGTYAVVLIDPLIMHSLKVIEFFATLTLQFQFILPLVVGSYLGGLPTVLNILSSKTYTS